MYNNDFQVEILDAPYTEERLINKMGDVEGVIVGEYPVTRKVMEASKSLKVISKVGVGVDKIDLTAASEKGIWVTN
ncbi:MAG: 3-phosphoglycerate dehydrogenase, partial [Atribacterota bacterium]|nr:3-phosphoglycerate dehydrogenase [Atribacterota bacterium]